MKLPEGWPTEEMVKAAKRIVTGPGGAVCRSTEYIFTEQFKAALAAAPTPPAQEDEPVYQRRFANYDEAAWFDVSRAEFDAENVIEKRIVYTRPQSAELRKAAEELRTYVTDRGLIDVECGITNLHKKLFAALERK